MVCISMGAFAATRNIYLDAANTDYQFILTAAAGDSDTIAIHMIDDGTPITATSYTPLLYIGKDERFIDADVITGTTNGCTASFVLSGAAISSHWDGRPVKLVYRSGTAPAYTYSYPMSGVLKVGDTLAEAGDPRAAAYFDGFDKVGVTTTEHGAGAIGTYAAPVTTRYTENGVIITDIKIDLTGLASVATANDVIGLAAGGAAYVGRNVVANNGIIYKMELICLETPAGGDNDVNVVAAASGALAYDGAGGTTYGINGGDAVAGQVVANLVQGLTANHYFYLTAGTGDTAAAYTAGQFIVRMYGHPAL